MKFRPRESESESDSSTYTKSELFAEETSEKEFESFKLGEEQFRLVSISVGRDDGVVKSKLGLSGIVQTQSGLHAKQTKGSFSCSSRKAYWSSVRLVHLRCTQLWQLLHSIPFWLILTGLSHSRQGYFQLGINLLDVEQDYLDKFIREQN